MLVLTRKPGQSVFVGDNVKVTLMEIRGNQVRLGIDAPPEVRIFREEIYRQILEENQKAAALTAEAPSDLTGIARAWKDQKPQALKGIKDRSGTRDEE